MTESSSHVAAPEDALEFLSDDQDAILELLTRYDSLVSDSGAPNERRERAEEVCTLVTVHAQIKREILYPAASNALNDAALVDEVMEAQDALEATIADIQAGDATEPQYDAGVRVLQELFVECVETERDTLFPALRDSTLDLTELGGELSARAEILLGGYDETGD